MRMLMMFPVLTLGVAAAAPFTPTQLAQLVKAPAQAKPTTTDKTGVRGDGTPVEQWTWNNVIMPDGIQFTRLTKQPQQWQLVLNETAYPLKTVAPGLKLLATTRIAYTAKDTGVKFDETQYLYAITSGPFKGAYLQRDMRPSIGNGLTIVTKDYDTAMAKRLPITKSSGSSPYPVADYLKNKAIFCKLEYVKCAP
ncbi:hypothetical protein [Deinococcus radiotolerans]|uniref:Uncharacterized protein n=1 Tax=Deinococcus radiotolerans TaxID=1309407 RepID=A0ABQ2FQZ4_9DEIO|nr:hypothetical protein [Deinococcus radiotolerans]GGL18275.1 hypothetical protein GCM10010844_41420 [Deinococcus radiotolerans]